MRLSLILPLLMAGCFFRGGDDTADGSGGAEECGDVDGAGGDTGDVPNILGKWTTTFGTQSGYDGCNLEGMGLGDQDWINGSAMEIRGRPPDNLYAVFLADEEERFWGVENSYGGVAFTGQHEQEGWTMVGSFGGMLFDNEYLERDEIRGHAFMGIDTIGDGYLDCWIQGDFIAKKSGN